LYKSLFSLSVLDSVLFFSLSISSVNIKAS
jgi:hypothetical protein